MSLTPTTAGRICCSCCKPRRRSRPLSRGLRATWPKAIAVALFALVWASPAALAATEKAPPFAFAGGESLSLDAGDLERPVEVAIVNNTASSHQLSARLVGFSAAESAADLSPTLTLSKTSVTLPEAGEANVVLVPETGDRFANGVHGGQLVIAEPATDTILRLPISVTVPMSSQKLEPAIEKLSISMISDTPGAGGDFDVSGNVLPLTLPATAREDGPIVRPVEKPLGYVSSGDAIASVWWSGGLEPIADEKALGAVLEVKDVTAVGEYTGTIDLLPGEDGGEVEITVGVTDAIGWAVAALLAGILLVLLGKRWLGVNRVRNELSERLFEIRETYRRASEDFAAATAGRPYGAYDISKPFEAAAEKAEKKIKGLSRALVGVDAKAHDEANALLGSMREAADSWQPFGEDLVALSEQLTTLNAELPSDTGSGGFTWPSQRPKITEAKAPLLQGRSFEMLAELSERRGEVTAAIDLLGYWRSLFGLVKTYRDTQQRLIPEYNDHQGPKRIALDGLDEPLQRVANGLWTVTDEVELAEREIKEDLKEIADVLASFPPARVTSDADPDAAVATNLYMADPALATTVFAAPAVRTAGKPAPDVDWAGMAAGLRRRRFRIDLVVAGTALGVALLTGLNENYFGKEFGTCPDYLTAFLWGGATEAALSGLLAALGRVGSVGEALAAPATLTRLSGGAEGGFGR